MQAKKRYGAVLFVAFCFTILCFILSRNAIFVSQKSRKSLRTKEQPIFTSYLDASDIAVRSIFSSEKESVDLMPPCSMERCFNFTQCMSDFKVYIYPPINDRKIKISESYSKILTTVRDSQYYTANINDACLFLLTFDSLDRDKLSTDFVKNFQKRLDLLPRQLWNNGRNHLIFNLYSGSWPDYNEQELGFLPEQAILAKASFSLTSLRSHFDISLPLFHRILPIRGGDILDASLHYPPFEKHMLVFKGKRYVFGIGSETRNALFHLHNGEDIVMLTTCKHGRQWEELKDERCEEDNANYERWDYGSMLGNATFCLVPRGRRLGSFRFLEALQAGCIPVILSNEWELPFSEVIDWTKAVIWADERLLFQVPDIIRSISAEKIFAMRQQCQRLYYFYFSSIEKIVLTTLEIIRDRIQRWKARSSIVWNQGIASGLYHVISYSPMLKDYPFYPQLTPNNYTSVPYFTAIIWATQQLGKGKSSNLVKLIHTLAKATYVHKILVLWPNKTNSLPENLPRWPYPKVLLEILDLRENTVFSRFQPFREIGTSAIFSVEDHVQLNTDEVNFAIEVWRYFPDRLIGYFTRSHDQATNENTYRFTSEPSNEYSMILSPILVYHSYYNFLYAHSLSPSVHRIVEESNECHDLVLNMLIADVTRQPPIKLTLKLAPDWSVEETRKREFCLNSLVSMFGHMSLRKSKIRLDPVLFRDSVDRSRKKYRGLEGL